MRVLPGLAITDAMLTSSSVAEDTAAAWSGATTYAAGALVRVVSTNYHRTFESAQATNTNHNPVTDDGTWWTELGPTNRWKMFDLVRDKPNTGTTDASPIVVVITPGQRIDSIALVGLDATQIDISVTVSASPVYTYSESLSTRGTTSWYEYFFGPFSYKTAVARIDIPPYSNAVITVTITNTGGAVVVGGLFIGLSIYLGRTQYQPVDSATNYSRITRDEFGTATLVKRRTVPKTTQKVMCSRQNVARSRKVREELNATPALWLGIDDNTHEYFEPLLLFGIYKIFDIGLDYIDDAMITLELEEV